MKGDFSTWAFDPRDNHAGVLHQQGKVLLDGDWNSAQRVQGHWNGTLAQDAIGAFVLAAPAQSPDAFKVLAAAEDGTGVKVTLAPGRAWADGILVYKNDGPALLAEPLGPPFQALPQPDIASGTRDAVLLEVWEEELNAFQDPVHLLEPALGGTDTTERIQVAVGLKLLRLAPGEDCDSIAGKIQDDMGSRGKLTVTPKPEVVLGSDCPVQTGGGYTGFEHYLYRIEIAEPEGGEARFKWSQFNGGLVGRGRFDSAAKKVSITANDQMINHCGLPGFYLEALRFDADRGHWVVHFTADATLSADGELSLANADGDWPAPSATAFFRLWNGIARVADYRTSPLDPKELKDGIRLEFDSPGTDLTKYQPGNYWTFPVRAAGVPFDPSLWPNHQPPQGARHRVPLAVLEWDAAAPATLTAEAGRIHDCRRTFQPLTSPCGCCYRVGDGRTTFGEFNSVEEALAHLPAKGGKLCLLAGIHRVNALIRGRRNIYITGCDRQTLLIPRIDQERTPLIRILDSQGIFIRNLDMVALASDAVAAKASGPGKLKDLGVDHTRIVACRHAISIADAEGVRIERNLIRMLDRDDGREAILCQASEAVIQGNDLGTVPVGSTPPPGETPPPTNPDPSDPCADAGVILKDLRYVPLLAFHLWELKPIFLLPANPYRTLGGIRIVGGSDGVRILENRIAGGAGNGITLGGGFDREAKESPPPRSDTPVFTLNNSREAVFGRFLMAGQPKAGTVVALQDAQGGAYRTAVSDASGEFRITAPQGDYTVHVLSPGLRLSDAKTFAASPLEPEHQLVLAEDAAPADDDGLDLAFVRNTVIESNEIARMGLSGIGVPVQPRAASGLEGNIGRSVLAQAFGLPGGFVLDLSIHRNRIHDCLLNPFTPALLALARSIGLGGISLGICENLVINENRIESNGTRHVDPVCGIFIAFANRADIMENRILDNGPLVPAERDEPSPGMRGGIVIRLAAALSLADQALASSSSSSGNADAASLESVAANGSVFPKGQYAARVIDNFVQQPLNQSLVMMALGPVRVTGNFFHSDVALGAGDTALQGGAVRLMNLGSAAFSGRLPLPGGQTLFQGNQARVGRGIRCATAQLFLCADDLGLEGNQSAVGPARGLIGNTLASAGTVRAIGNRFQEGSSGVKASMLSLFTQAMRLNNTSGNQGDHCIEAVVQNQTQSQQLVNQGNQVAGNPLGCQRFRQTFLSVKAKVQRSMHG